MNSEKTKDFFTRILISSVFIYTVPVKIINFERIVQTISTKKIFLYQ